MQSIKVVSLLICSLLLLNACGGGDNVSSNPVSTPIVVDPQPIPKECLGPYPFDIYSYTDEVRPQITLVGDATVQLQVGDIYQDQGATAADSTDGDLTASIVVTGIESIDTSQVGDYLLRYNVRNFNSVTAVETVRIVRVSDAENYPIQTKRHREDVSAVYGYFEHLPASYAKDTPLPLIISNHGIGEAANFDQADSDEFANSGDLLDRLLRRGFPGMMHTGNWDESRQFIVLSPQRCLDGGYNEAARVNDFLQYALQTYNIDPKRIYMVGFSAGAYVSWVHEAFFLGEVAALVAIAGGTKDIPDTCEVKDTPSWTFHAEDDGTVSADISQQMYAEFNDCDPQPDIQPKLTLFADGGHLIDVSTLDLSRLNTGNPLYDIYDQSVYEWLLGHSLP
jgi:predicted esterase